jgi:hypothetical protein
MHDIILQVNKPDTTPIADIQLVTGKLGEYYAYR